MLVLHSCSQSSWCQKELEDHEMQAALYYIFNKTRDVHSTVDRILNFKMTHQPHDHY